MGADPPAGVELAVISARTYTVTIPVSAGTYAVTVVHRDQGNANALRREVARDRVTVIPN